MRQYIITSVLITAIIGHIMTRVVLADAYQVSAPAEFSVFYSASVSAAMDSSFIHEVQKVNANDKANVALRPDGKDWKTLVTMIEE